MVGISQNIIFFCAWRDAKPFYQVQQQYEQTDYVTLAPVLALKVLVFQRLSSLNQMPIQ